MFLCGKQVASPKQRASYKCVGKKSMHSYKTHNLNVFQMYVDVFELFQIRPLIPYEVMACPLLFNV